MSLLQMDNVWTHFMVILLGRRLFGRAGKEVGVMKAKASMMELFDCDVVGKLLTSVGCKVDYDQEAGTMRLTQPVMIQSFQDEFDLPEVKASSTPAIPGTVMSEGEVKNQVSIKTQAPY
jgi:hypothetical protein